MFDHVQKKFNLKLLLNAIAEGCTRDL